VVGISSKISTIDEVFQSMETNKVGLGPKLTSGYNQKVRNNSFTTSSYEAIHDTNASVSVAAEAVAKPSKFTKVNDNMRAEGNRAKPNLCSISYIHHQSF